MINEREQHTYTHTHTCHHLERLFDNEYYRIHAIAL